MAIDWDNTNNNVYGCDDVNNSNSEWECDDVNRKDKHKIKMQWDIALDMELLVTIFIYQFLHSSLH